MKNDILTMGQFETRIGDIFSMAEMCSMPHAEILKRFDTQVYAELNRKTGIVRPRRVYSAFMSGFVAGIKQARFNALYREKRVIYGAYVNGAFYSTHSDRPDYYEKHGISAREFSEAKNNSGHYWTNGKPFFVSGDAA